MSIPTSQFNPLNSLGVHIFGLYICVSIYALHISTSVPHFFFFGFHIYALIYSVSFSLSDLPVFAPMHSLTTSIKHRISFYFRECSLICIPVSETTWYFYLHTNFRNQKIKIMLETHEVCVGVAALTSHP